MSSVEFFAVKLEETITAILLAGFLSPSGG
jgi:hypothetical protein